MNEENLYLVYINEIGKDWKGEFIYEFLFSHIESKKFINKIKNFLFKDFFIILKGDQKTL